MRPLYLGVDDGAHLGRGLAADRTVSRVVFASDGDPTGGNADGNWELFLAATGSGQVSQLTDTAAPAVASDPSISGDGQRVVFISTAELTPGQNPDHRGQVLLLEVPSGQLTVIAPSTARANQPTLTPDGTHVLFESSVDLVGQNPNGVRQLFLYDIAGHTAIQVTATQTAYGSFSLYFYDVSMSADGSSVAYTLYLSAGGPFGATYRWYGVFLWRQGVGRQRISRNDSASAPAISGDGLLVAYKGTYIGPDFPSSNDTGTDLYHVATGQRSSFATSDPAGFLQDPDNLVLNERGDRLAFTRGNSYHVYELDLATGDAFDTAVDHNLGYGFGLYYHPFLPLGADGDRVLGRTAAGPAVSTCRAPDLRPQATFSLTPSRGRAPLLVSVDATASTASSHIRSYEWDFGDGASAQGVTAQHTYPSRGTFSVSLRVTDDQGRVGSWQRTVRVSPNPQVLVGLGDSFSSGEGIEGTYDTPGGALNDCHRSFHAYPRRTPPGINNVELVACSGATTSHFLGAGGQHGQPTQIVRLSQLDADPNTDVAVVTLTIGGNDLGFATTITDCALAKFDRPGTSCQEAYSARFAEALATLQTRLATLYRGVHAAAPDARVIVLGYPAIFPEDPSHLCEVRRSDAQWLRHVTGLANNAIRVAAMQAGVTYLDVFDAFHGHELCNTLSRDDDWVNGVVGLAQPESFHPKSQGHSALSALLLSCLAGGAGCGNDRSTNLVPGERETYPTRVDTSTGVARWSIAWPGSTVALQLTSPSGRVIDGDTVAADVTHSGDATSAWIELEDPAAGLWTATLDAVDVDPTGEPAALTVTEQPREDPPANHAPAADFVASPTGESRPLAVTFDGYLSGDIDGTVVSYRWEFGDGAVATGTTASHSYAVAGDYTPTLTVTDDHGSTDAIDGDPIHVTAPPGPPTAVTALAGDGQVTLYWAPPSSIGSSPVSSYRVFRDGTLLHQTTSALIRDHTDTGLVNGATYSYEISAVNAAGESTRSSSVAAVPRPAHRPDVSIATAPAGPYKGADVYTDAVSPAQTLRSTVARSQTTVFHVRVDNDGAATDSLVLEAADGTTSGFAVSYFRGRTDITAQVRAGTYRVDDVAPEGSFVIKIKVTARAASTRGAIRTADLSVRSASAPSSSDVVRAKATRR